ncbi:MAG: hypothetical protein WGN25_04375 [Candidatus Electrothrix sp. GW3-4]|uniref:hypothetical protein n=1 Tax=Candidatus Electrothrix sp. GW3-4 TaxID=3126740 RepID=UPI0030CFAD0A
MKSLFYSSTFSKRNNTSLAPSSPLATRTVPVSGFKLDKKNSVGKEKNNRAVRRNTRFSPGLLLDYTLFSYILAVDAGLTAEVFLRDRLRGKRSLPA